MDNFSLNGEIRAEIHKKLDEHIRQILEKPTISVEEHNLLEWVDSRYAEMDKKLASTDSGYKGNWLLPALLLFAFSDFGGDKNGL